MGDLTFDQSLYEQAKAEGETLSRDEVIRFIDGLLTLGATKRDIGPKDNFGLWFTATMSPMETPKKANARWRLLEQVVDLIPEELWAGTKAEDGTFSSGALASINYGALLQSLVDAGGLSETQKREAIKAIPTATQVFTQLTEAQLTQAGMPEESVQSVVENLDTSSVSVNAGGLSITDLMAGGGYAMDNAGVAKQLQIEFQKTIDDLMGSLGMEGEFRFSSEGFWDPQGGIFGEQKWKYTESLSYPYQLDKDRMSNLQRSLAAGGYFEAAQAIYRELGTMDDATALAWRLLLTDAATLDKAPWEVLQDKIKSADTRMEGALGVGTYDPATIWTVGQEAGEKILGRGLTDNELNLLGNKMNEWYREAVSADWKFRDPNAERVDMESRIQQYLSKTYSTDAIVNTIADALSPLQNALR